MKTREATRPHLHSGRFSFVGVAVVAVLMALAPPALGQQPTGQQQANAPAAVPSPPPPPIVGVWYDDTGEGAVEIAPCGNVLCGRIVWLKSPNDKAGRPLTDGYNPDARKRNQPICGLQVIGNLKQVGANSWDAGWIYDPKEGKSYDVAVAPHGPNRIKVTGYLGVKFLSQTFIWQRAPDNLVRCTVSKAL